MEKKPELVDLVLLKVDPEAHPLYFVLAVPRPADPRYAEAGHNQFLYDEHTCPTNWTGEIVAVVSRGDDDPHGFATFVRRIQAPPGMDINGNFDRTIDEAVWTALFPEVKDTE